MVTNGHLFIGNYLNTYQYLCLSTPVLCTEFYLSRQNSFENISSIFKGYKKSTGSKGPATNAARPSGLTGCALDSTPALGGCVLHMWIESTQLLTSEKAVLLQSWRPHLCGEIEVSVVKPEKKPEGQKEVGKRNPKGRMKGNLGQKVHFWPSLPLCKDTL